MSTERLVATACAERFSLVHYRPRQSHTAVTAPLTGLGIKIDHLEILRWEMKKAQRNAGPVVSSEKGKRGPGRVLPPVRETAIPAAVETAGI